MSNHFKNNIVNLILNIFNKKFFYKKNILDAGVGYGQFTDLFYSLFSNITCLDGRQIHLLNIKKKYPKITTIKANFEKPLNFKSKFDIGISIDTLCHLYNYEQHLKDLCLRCNDLILETAVYNSSDKNLYTTINEDTSVDTLSMYGNVRIPSDKKIEEILSKNKMYYFRLDVPELNSDNYKYDWISENGLDPLINYRRFWICSKKTQTINQIKKRILEIDQNKIENKSNIENVLPEQNIEIILPPVSLETNLSGAVYHFIPWSTNKNLGEWYNRCMSLLKDEDWACFLDGDAVHTTTYFGRYIEQIISNNPDYGLLTCYTNRIGCLYQIPGNYWNNDSQAYHRTIGNKLWHQYGTNIIDITDKSPLSGVLILINKLKWSQVGGFKEEKMLSIDNDIHLRFKNAGFKVGLMQGIYVQHWYRNGKQKDKNHLL